jgi:hypothetical protein
MNMKSILLSAVMVLPVLGVAHAQSWDDRQDLREDLRINRQQYREAVRRGDWARANDEARQIQADERRLDRSNYYLQNNTGWNNGYYYRSTPYNNGWYNRVNSYPYVRTYP